MPIGINPVQQPRQEIKEKEETDVDKLFKYLQIANTGMGIAVNFDKIRYGGERAQAEIDYKKSQQSYMEKQTAGLPSEEESQQLRSTAKEQAVIGRQQKLADNFTNDPTVKTARVTLTALPRARAILAKEKLNSGDLATAKSIFLEGITTGPVTEQDIERSRFTADAKSKMLDLIGKAANNEAFVPEVNAMRNVLEIMEESAKSRIMDAAKFHSSGPGANEFGTPEQVMKNIFRFNQMANFEDPNQIVRRVEGNRTRPQEKDTAFSPIGFDRTDSK